MSVFKSFKDLETKAIAHGNVSRKLAQGMQRNPAGLNGALSPAADEIDLAHKDKSRKARYLWAILLARIDEAFPLTDRNCAGEMRIIAFVTDPISIQAILAQLGNRVEWHECSMEHAVCLEVIQSIGDWLQRVLA